MKRFITAMLALTLTLSIGASLTLAAEAVNVTIDGEAQTYEVPAQIINGRTMLPLRAVCESLGMEVDYDEPTKTATMEKDNKTVIHVIGTKTITVEGLSKEFDTASTVIEGRTLVPIRMLAEAIGANVDWIAEARTAVITTAAATPTPEPPKQEPEPQQPIPEGSVMIGDVPYDSSKNFQYGGKETMTPEQAGLFWASLLEKSQVTIYTNPDNPKEFAYTDFDFTLVPLPNNGNWLLDYQVRCGTAGGSVLEASTSNISNKQGTVQGAVESAITLDNGHFSGTFTTHGGLKSNLDPEKYGEALARANEGLRLFHSVRIYAEFPGSGATVLEATYNPNTGKTTAYYMDNRLNSGSVRVPISVPNLITVK